MSIAQMIAEFLYEKGKESGCEYCPLIAFGIALFIGIMGPIILGAILSN